MRILAVGSALPDHDCDQESLVRALEHLWSAAHHNPTRIRRFFEAVQVEKRHLALPVEAYAQLKDFGQANDAWLRVGCALARRAIDEALASSGLEAQDIDVIVSTTVTGIAAPSLDARLFHQGIGFRDDILRLPLFGLGCVAGAAGLARTADLLAGLRDKAAILLSVELCSLTLQSTDFSIANLVASGLFGDGAAAIVAVGPDHPLAGRLQGPWVRASHSRLYPDSERVMGWDVTATGLKIVLDKSVPDVVDRFIAQDVAQFLAHHGLTRQDITHWLCHTGGPKVIDAFQRELGLSAHDVALTRESLARVGNLSSASVLFVLGDLIAKRHPAPGDLGLMIALGPGFCSEIVLLEW